MTTLSSLGISFGHSESQSEQEQISLDAQSSTFNATRGTVRFTATGREDADGNRLPSDQDSEEGTIHLTGTQVSAQSIGLDANNHLILDAATNQTKTTSSNSSSGWGVGVDIGASGVGLNAHANRGQGNSNGNAISYQGTSLAANTITMTSGGDTRIIGSTVKGNRIDAHIAGELEITSLQDTNEYHNTQESQGVNVGYNFATGVGSLGYNDSTGTVDGDRASVVNQAGFYAGKGGLNLTVKGTSTLTGGVISSDAPSGSNTFTTGGLEHSDLNNHAEWEAHQTGHSVNVGFGGNAPAKPWVQAVGNLAANATPGMEDGYQATGVSQATITDNIHLTLTQPTTDGADPLAGLNRDKDQIDAGNVEQDVQGMLESLELMQVHKQNAQAFSKLGGSIVGDIGVEMGWDPESPQMAILHGAVGAIAAELGGGDAANGALSGMLNKLLVSYLDDKLSGLNTKEREIILKAFSQIIGTAVGMASGDNNNATLNHDVNSNLTEFNYLAHEEAVLRARLEEDLTKCLREKNCSEDKVNRIKIRIEALNQLDKERDIALISTCASGNRIECGLLLKDSWNALNTYGLRHLNIKSDDEYQAVFGIHPDKIRLEAQSIDAIRTLASNVIIQRSGQELQAQMNAYGLGAVAGAGTSLAVIAGITSVNGARTIIATCGKSAACYTYYANLIVAETVATTPEFGGSGVAMSSLYMSADDLAKLIGRTPNLKQWHLIDEVLVNGHKISPTEVIDIRSLPNGKTVWLETGSSRAGLIHIIKEHGAEFAQRNLSESQIPDVLFTALEKGNIVGYQGKGVERPIYEFIYNGIKHRLAITVGNNGFIVGANFISSTVR